MGGEERRPTDKERQEGREDGALRKVLLAHAEFVQQLAEVADAAVRSGKAERGGGPFSPPAGKSPPMDDMEWLSEEGRELLSVLTDDFQTVKAISLALGWTQSARDRVDDRLRFLLHEYVGRKAIERSPDGDGYRLRQKPAE